MSEIDLSKLSAEQFAELQQQIKSEQDRREKEHIEALFQRVADLSAKDFSLLFERMKQHLVDQEENRKNEIFSKAAMVPNTANPRTDGRRFN